ncbi:MAG: hypothetical protein H6686_13000 [Fibrobacteria bacterium]|nr:hypothetical protein [Fibrobacteria bacterium]
MEQSRSFSWTRWCLLLAGPMLGGAAVHAGVPMPWDSLKAAAAPRVVSESFAASHGSPRRLSLATSGWEDGLQVSADGLDLYALYVPADFLSWSLFIASNPTLGICELLGTDRFRRADAPTFGSDQVTNPVGCSGMLNVDILHAHRRSLADPFTQWNLSGYSRPFLAEGGPFPLAAAEGSDSLSHVLFTGDGDIWWVRKTVRELDGIEQAERLPAPINPVSKEFVADNPVLVRLGGDSLLLVYEKYTDGEQRAFMIARSPDDGKSWSAPQAMKSVTTDLGRIEHPMPVRDADGNWWLWFSLDFDLVRAKAAAGGQWDSWSKPEVVVSKGNTAGLGEPSLSRDGSLYFSVVLERSGGDSSDRFDIDPWVLPALSSTGQVPSVRTPEAVLHLTAGWARVGNPEDGESLEVRRMDGRRVQASLCASGNSCGVPLPSGIGIVNHLAGTRLLGSEVFVRP